MWHPATKKLGKNAREQAIYRKAMDKQTYWIIKRVEETEGVKDGAYYTGVTWVEEKASAMRFYSALEARERLDRFNEMNRPISRVFRVGPKPGPKFKNAVEESIWVSFVCSAMQSTAQLEADGQPVGCVECADILLNQYRARLQDGKPSAK